MVAQGTVLKMTHLAGGCDEKKYQKRSQTTLEAEVKLY